ncbi:GNAT family N-acetyltransferase [Brumimicrobium glaciale]|uniref:GNAT family N-acetyltransferase n=1 Tax=Brumimicrobium glaciale TaxID=200475 RepID=A0A4Q4KND7_9FLAO|nr:GNAT family N-acetyltransferase [Brumimicrobium glaciale]RYM33439.1 GNAT family N-acetyltransferase [Brumimicrobium glaciale]
MNRVLINSIKSPFFQEAWELYLSAFPIDERRELAVQEKIFTHEDYHFEIVVIENEFIGFITWWQFEGLRYIEHFATLPIHRGKGYGKSILEKFISENEEQAILEVELPNSEIDKRRIGFYERLNFKLNPHKYQQLPYRFNGAKVDLMIMSYPTKIDEVKLAKFEKDFKEKCFDGIINIV